ncbi:MAG: transposase [Burkholderiales bacterium]|nr:transposase [Burkholderiales bacterium]
MSDYRRAIIPGATYFFTVVSYRRRPILCEPEIRTALHEAINWVRELRPFTIDAWVLLPDHLHTIWTLPANEADFATRWQSIKRRVSSQSAAFLLNATQLNTSKIKRREASLWQRRFWEHCIRDDHDFARHMDYLHYNPVKHGLVTRVQDWPYSTFHRHVKAGRYPLNWGGQAEGIDIVGAE